MAFKIEDAKQFEHLWRQRGVTEDGVNLELKDVLAVPNATVFLPKVISNIAREAMEPLLVGTSLLQRINYKAGQTITFPAVGALVAADIPEGGEYPERTPQRGGAVVTANVGKHGLAVKVTDEMIRYSQFDLIGLLLREAGRALARHKEKKIFDYIASIGAVMFDNVTPTTSMQGVTTGRNLSGAGNGSVTMDDYFDCFSQIMVQGFIPDTILMHPLTWLMHVKDPVLRAFALANGGGSFFANWSGQVNQQSWANALMGGLQGGAGQNVIPGGNAAGLSATEIEGYNPQMTGAPVLPNYFGIPFRIVVSPFVFFDPRRRLTDIYIFDSRELGALVVDEDVTTEQFTDVLRDMQKIKLRERYGIAMFHEGQQIAVMRNVHVVPNEIVLPAMAAIDVSGQIATINPTGNVL